MLSTAVFRAPPGGGWKIERKKISYRQKETAGHRGHRAASHLALLDSSSLSIAQMPRGVEPKDDEIGREKAQKAQTLGKGRVRPIPNATVVKIGQG